MDEIYLAEKQRSAEVQTSVSNNDVKVECLDSDTPLSNMTLNEKGSVDEN